MIWVQSHRQTDRQTDRQTNIQTDRQTISHLVKVVDCWGKWFGCGRCGQLHKCNQQHGNSSATAPPATSRHNTLPATTTTTAIVLLLFLLLVCRLPSHLLLHGDDDDSQSLPSRPIHTKQKTIITTTTTTTTRIKAKQCQAKQSNNNGVCLAGVCASDGRNTTSKEGSKGGARTEQHTPLCVAIEKTPDSAKAPTVRDETVARQ